MADFSERVIALNLAAWSLREASPSPSSLPFALALFSDFDRSPDILGLVKGLPETERPVAVIFRHDQLPDDERLALAGSVCGETQARGHVFIMARGELADADGCHAFPEGPGIKTMPAHNEEELMRATLEADAAFLSPVFPTASHPGASCLGRERAVALAQAARVPLFALGGLNEERAAELEGTPFQGFGAIGAFSV